MLLSLEWRFSRGRFLTPALLGYDRVEVPDGHGGRKKVLAVNEDEARTVRLMYYMLLSGSSPTEIAATLTEPAPFPLCAQADEDGAGIPAEPGG